MKTDMKDFLYSGALDLSGANDGAVLGPDERGIRVFGGAQWFALSPALLADSIFTAAGGCRPVWQPLARGRG